MTEQDILKFIKGFTEVKDFFLFGYCYWFAVILEQHFGGVICYLPIKNHFVTRIHNVYYDASGRVVPDEQVFVWSTYLYKYPTECRSIIRGCIDKIE
jgi:hypothetical protein